MVKKAYTREEVGMQQGFGACWKCLNEGRKKAYYKLEDLITSEFDPAVKHVLLCEEHYQKFKRGEFEVR